MDYDTFSHYFSYDPYTGVVRWKRDVGQRARAGEVAGYWDKNHTGYQLLRLHRKRTYAHIVAYCLMTGKMPENQMDHINGDRIDNRWKNLRAVTPQENQRNRKLQKNNKTGVTGVYFSPEKKRWSVTVSKKYIGTYSTLLEAAAVRKSAELKHGYHPNHGSIR